MFSVLAVSAPTGVWANLIEWVHSWVGGGYGWTILVLIVLLKLVMSPLDYLIKHSSKKQNLVQQKIAPEMAKLQKKFGDNQQMIQQQQQALFKREKFNVAGSCVVMLVNLVLTLVIFTSLFSGLRTLSAYQAIKQYEELNTAYTTSVTTSYGTYEEYKTIAEFVASTEETKGVNNLDAHFGEGTKQKWDEAYAVAQTAVQAEWENASDSWLWIDNIWVNDGKENPFPTLNALTEMANQTKVDEYKNTVKSINDDAVLTLNYNNIANMVSAKTGHWNGYYILAILAIGLSVLSQYISELSNKNKNKKAQALINQSNPQNKSMWFMKLLVPVMMAIFVFTTNSAFGIYVVTNSIMSTITGIITNAIVQAVFKKKQAEVDEYLQKEALKQEKKQARISAKKTAKEGAK